MEQTKKLECGTDGLTPVVPTGKSGVTVMGVDFGVRSQQEVHNLLREIGVEEGIAKTFSKAAGLTGDSAKSWVKGNSTCKLTPAQGDRLFDKLYNDHRGKAQDSLGSGASSNTVDFATDLSFQCGSINSFPKTLESLKKGDIDGAIIESAKSLVAVQTPGRAESRAEMLKGRKFTPDEKIAFKKTTVEHIESKQKVGKLTLDKDETRNLNNMKKEIGQSELSTKSLSRRDSSPPLNNTSSVASSSTPPITQVTNNSSIYVIQPKDCISKIASQHNTTVDAIKSLNPKIKDINKIKAGGTLNLPKRTRSEVPNEMKLNNMLSPNTVQEPLIDFKGSKEQMYQENRTCLAGGLVTGAVSPFLDDLFSKKGLNSETVPKVALGAAIGGGSALLVKGVADTLETSAGNVGTAVTVAFAGVRCLKHLDDGKPGAALGEAALTAHQAVMTTGIMTACAVTGPPGWIVGGIVSFGLGAFYNIFRN
jgi:LysM repeat protein